MADICAPGAAWTESTLCLRPIAHTNGNEFASLMTYAASGSERAVDSIVEGAPRARLGLLSDFFGVHLVIMFCGFGIVDATRVVLRGGICILTQSLPPSAGSIAGMPPFQGIQTGTRTRRHCD